MSRHGKWAVARFQPSGPFTVGGGHIGGQLGPTHFGLGPATEAQVRVQWPDGEQGPWTTVKADQPTIIER